MRLDRNTPHQGYENYWDWLRTGYNFVWVISLFIGYFCYLLMTREA